MSAGKPLLYELINPNTGGYYYVDDAGEVQESIKEISLARDPDAWRDTLIEYTRSKTYWGLFRSFSTPYKFADDGRTILKKIYAEQDVNGACTIVIKRLRLDGTSDSYLYDVLYTGKLDFVNFKCDRDFATVNIAEGGIVDQIFKKEDTTYEVLLDADDADKIYLDGYYLQSRWEYVEVASNVILGTNSTPHDTHFSPFSPSLEDDEFNAGTAFEVFRAVGGGPVVGNYFFRADRPGQYTFTYDGLIAYYLNVAAASDIKLLLTLNVYQDENNTAVPTQTLELYRDPNWLSPNDSRVLGINQTGVFTLDAGNIVTFTVDDVWGSPDYTGTPPSDVYRVDYYDDTKMIVTGLFRLPATKCLGYPAHTLWEKLIDKIGYTGTSTYLTDGTITKNDTYGLLPPYLYVTVGDAIRGLDTFNRASDPSITDPKFKTTLKEVFQALSSVAGLGMMLDPDAGEAQLKTLPEILNTSLSICDLGEVSKFTYAPAADLMAETLNVGYPNQDVDVQNGKYEYNTTSQWDLPVRSDNTISRVSEIRGDSYGIESIRNKYWDKITTDYKADNHKFFLQVDPVATIDDAMALYRPQNDYGPVVVGGIIPINNELAYNLGITPKRNLLRNGRLLHSICNNVDGDIFRFQYVDKNPNLSAKIDDSGVIAEISSVNVSSLMRQLFKPIYFTFTSKIPYDLISLVAATPSGYISFKVDGVEFKGFPVKIGVHPASMETYNVTLLAHPSTDMGLL